MLKIKVARILASCLLTVALAMMTVLAKQSFQQVAVFDAPEANQGVAVDQSYFYAITNQAIAKHDKVTGKLVARWEGPKDGPVIHLDSGVVVDGKLYCAHSNYSQWPMASSVEIWDTATMKHVDTYSFGIRYGSFTWLDRYDGYWWGTFANYDQPYGPNKTPYGYKSNTLMCKFDDKFQVLEAWTLPTSILDKFELMSNSGGSWGSDGYLYLSGHDPVEVYKMELPEAGSVLKLVEVLPLNIAGQGIAWDRSNPGILWGIIRKTKQVTASKLLEQ